MSYRSRYVGIRKVPPKNWRAERPAGPANQTDGRRRIIVEAGLPHVPQDQAFFQDLVLALPPDCRGECDNLYVSFDIELIEKPAIERARIQRDLYFMLPSLQTFQQIDFRPAVMADVWCDNP